MGTVRFLDDTLDMPQCRYSKEPHDVAQGYFCNPYVQFDHRQHGSHLQGLHARPILVTLDIHTSAVPR